MSSGTDSQEDLADATGMTPIHANRMLKQLREDGLVELKSKVMTILDPKRLRKVAQYDSKYLHLVRTERRDRRVSDRAGDLVTSRDGGLIDKALGKIKTAFGG